MYSFRPYFSTEARLKIHNFKFNIFLNLGYRLNISRKQCFISNMKTNSWRILDLMKPSKVSYDKIVKKISLLINLFSLNLRIVTILYWFLP